MHALRTRDISAFRPAQMPHTSAKDRQKLESVVGPDRILRDFLEAGRLPACSHFDGRTWEVRVNVQTAGVLVVPERESVQDYIERLRREGELEGPGEMIDVTPTSPDPHPTGTRLSQPKIGKSARRG